jgi:transcriptional regulator with XRE-family HTH domain
MDEKLQRTLGEMARAARLRLGLTQEEVANRVGLAQSVYGRIERGKMMPSVPTLRKLCLVLDISSEVLLSLGHLDGEGAAPDAASTPELGEHPELSRIVHLLHDWPPKRLALLRKLLEVAEANLAE